MSARLAPDQRAMLDIFERFVREPLRGGERNWRSGFGEAGTGKTIVLEHLAQVFQHAILAAPTNKAADNLQKKTGHQANTIHTLLYHSEEIFRADGTRELRWKDKDFRADLIIVDESSMVPAHIGVDITKRAKKVITVGDSGQLPPIDGVAFFVTEDARLVTNHRQLIGSGIINQAKNVLAGEPYSTDGDFDVLRSNRRDAVLAADVVLCHKNVDREKANCLIREWKGLPADALEAGEEIIATASCRKHGIFNSYRYRVAKRWRPYPDNNPLVIIGDDGKPRDLGKWVFVEGFAPRPDDNRRAYTYTTNFAPAYCLTVHKAQGSEWHSVFVWDDYTRGEDRQAWLYTAITRAQTQLWISDGIDDAPSWAGLPGPTTPAEPLILLPEFAAMLARS